MQCPKCQTENPDGSIFCRECGSKFQHSCEQCGKAILPGDKFCNACGHNLQAAITTKPEDHPKEKPIPLPPSEAEAHFNKATELAGEIGTRGLLAQAHLGLGLIHRTKGRTEKARESISRAIEIFEEIEAGGFLKQAREALASF